MPKVLMLTAVEDSRLREHCLKHKYVDFFVTKNVHKKFLISVIADL